MLGADAGIVEPGGDGVRLLHLPLLVLQDLRVAAVQHPRPAALQRRPVSRRLQPLPRGLDAHQLHPRIGDEIGEDADGVRTTADARDDHIRQMARRRKELRARLTPDHALELAHDEREGMWPRDGAEQIVRRGVRRGPVAKRLVDRGLERRAPLRHRHHLGAHQPHPLHVRLLPLDVGGAHIDPRGDAEHGAGERGRHPMLARAGLRDEARLAEPTREEPLPERLVGLVRPAMQQVLALEPDPRAGLDAEVAALVQRRRTAGVGAEQRLQLGPERGVGLRGEELRLERFERGDEDLGDEAAAEAAVIRGLDHASVLMETIAGGAAGAPRIWKS